MVQLRIIPIGQGFGRYNTEYHNYGSDCTHRRHSLHRL